MFKSISALSIFALAFFIASCGDDNNPVDTEHEEEHAEAVGLIIRNSGEEIVRYENGEVEGEIEVGHGLETALLSVRFIAEDGDLFTPDEDEGFALDWEIADESIAEVGHHEEDGAWAFHIVGLEEGQTTILIKISHEGHADFVSKEIEIHVEEGGPGSEDSHADEDHDEEG
ncbi:MAG: hypothetical protein J4F35_04920 [Candidatus Latescibacteria bacterium]|nr:hypothetical protein [Candidatus Latescibacterota bacterium]